MSASPTRTPKPSIHLPADALVLLVGVAGSGKTTLARRHFKATQVLSSDALRAVITDDPTDQRSTDDAFRLLHEILALRLARGRLTVVDATNVEAWARAQLLDVAWRYRRPAVALVLALPLEICLERNMERTDGRRPPAAVRRQQRWLDETLRSLPSEGFSETHALRTPQEVDALRISVAAPAGR